MFSKLLTTAAVITVSTSLFAAAPLIKDDSVANEKKFAIEFTPVSNKPSIAGIYNIDNIFAVETGLTHTYSNKLDTRVNNISSSFSNDYLSTVYAGIRATSPDQIASVKPFAMLGTGYYFNGKKGASNTAKEKLHGIAKVGAKYSLNDETDLHISYTRYIPNKNVTVAKNAVGVGMSYNF